MLTGTEIKSVRAGHVNLNEAYARVERREAWLVGAHIAPFEGGNRFNHESKRTRKLLLHRSEIDELLGLDGVGRASRSSRCGCTSATRVWRSSNWGSRAASSSMIAGARSPRVMRGATSSGIWPTSGAGGKADAAACPSGEARRAGMVRPAAGSRQRRPEGAVGFPRTIG